MKSKIIAIFKTMFPTLNLSNERLALIASRIETKIDGDETKINDELKTMDEYFPFATIASEDDRTRTLMARNKELLTGKTPQPETPPKTESSPDEGDDATTVLLKKILKQNEDLTIKISAIEQKEALGTIRGNLKSTLLKDIPESFWGKRVIPIKEDEVQAFVDEVNTDYAAFKQEHADKGLGVIGEVPIGGHLPKTGPIKKASDSEVASVVENLM